MKKILFLILIAVGIVGVQNTQAQCDTIATLCSVNISSEYISDGQVYRALLHDDEVAEFHSTFFGGSTYRVASCSGLTDGNLIFTILDNERNEMFNSEDFNNAPYWDFKVESTIDAVIEARLDLNKAASGCAVILIGFKQ